MKSNKFEYLMLFFIIGNSIQLAIDNPLNDPESNYSMVLFVIDIVITSVFLLEAMIKIVG